MSTDTRPGSLVPPAGPVGAPSLAPRRRVGEGLIRGVLLAAAVASVAITFGIIAALVGPVISFFGEVGFGEFFSTNTSQAENPFAVGPLVMGTFLTTVVSLALAVPIGLGAAMYLSEYATPRARRWLKPIVELLAGVPSVVYGFFAITFVTQNVLQGWLNLDINFFNSLSAGLVLGVMIIPTIASLSEDAMHAVPDALRQGSFAMGANRMQTTLRVVVPAALSGIAASVVLGLSRAVGETMIVTMAGGAVKNMSLNLGEPHMSMTGFIAIRFGSESSAVGSAPYNMLFAVALLLFAITFVLNLASTAVVRRFRQAY